MLVVAFNNFLYKDIEEKLVLNFFKDSKTIKDKMTSQNDKLNLKSIKFIQ